MTPTPEQRAKKCSKDFEFALVASFDNQEACEAVDKIIAAAIRAAVEEANTLNVSNIIEAAKDKIEAVDKALVKQSFSGAKLVADARKGFEREMLQRQLRNDELFEATMALAKADARKAALEEACKCCESLYKINRNDTYKRAILGIRKLMEAS